MGASRHRVRLHGTQRRDASLDRVIQTLLTSYLIRNSLHTNAGQYGPAMREAEYKTLGGLGGVSTMHCNRGGARASIAMPLFALPSVAPQPTRLSRC